QAQVAEARAGELDRRERELEEREALAVLPEPVFAEAADRPRREGTPDDPEEWERDLLLREARLDADEQIREQKLERREKAVELREQKLARRESDLTTFAGRMQGDLERLDEDWWRKQLGPDASDRERKLATRPRSVVVDELEREPPGRAR